MALYHAPISKLAFCVDGMRCAYLSRVLRTFPWCDWQWSPLSSPSFPYSTRSPVIDTQGFSS